MAREARLNITKAKVPTDISGLELDSEEFSRKEKEEILRWASDIDKDPDKILNNWKYSQQYWKRVRGDINLTHPQEEF